MMKNEIKNLLDFVQFTHEFREVIRIARSPNSERYENDAEHSYQLAMVAWYIIETDKLKLNKELIFMYALSHDLVEIYAGDTYVFDKNQSHHETKRQREKEALNKIKDRFPQFKSLIKAIEKYEQKKDKESKFIYALDKLIPPIQIYMEGGKLWHEKNVSFDQLVNNKAHKIAISPQINKYWKELHNILNKNRRKLFPKKTK
jgi:putative hydrolase of HD superfamily